MVEDALKTTFKDSIRLGIIGLSNENGHPYSWSAIFNGYDSEIMSHCPFPVIPDYLARQSFPEDCIPNATVTHVWTQEKRISKDIANSAKIKHIVDNFEDMIGEVDAILLARDDVESHLPISKVFLEAGLPVYIDKPIATDLKTLDSILEHEQYPGQIFSCSALRFAEEFSVSTIELAELGNIEYVEATIGKNWEKYGVHIIDPVLHLLGLSGEDSIVQIVKFKEKQIVIADWQNITIKFATLAHLYTPITIRLYGTQSMKELIFHDSFSAFKRALEVFIQGFTTRTHMITHRELRGVVSIIERGTVYV